MNIREYLISVLRVPIAFSPIMTKKEKKKRANAVYATIPTSFPVLSCLQCAYSSEQIVSFSFLFKQHYHRIIEDM